MTRRICPVPGCPAITTGGRCPTHAREAERRRGTRQQRGYNNTHDQTRKQWAPLVATGTVSCSRCHTLIHPTEPWALDHTDDRTTYLGPSHELCNNAAGGRAAHR